MHNDTKRDELVFTLIKDRFDKELNRTNNLDNKASNLISFISISTSILLGTGAFSISSLAQNSINVINYVTVGYIIGTASLILSIFFGLLAFKVRRWSIVPNVKHLIEEYTKKDKPYDEVLKINAGEMAKSIEEMELQNNDKANHIHYSWLSFIIGLAIVATTTFISIMILYV